ncbi:V8-like Glu-specific endopeptidase [Streptococcus pneumoniae]|nr:V8-like Glu-specific endopeptidase [Streptococcus pneumoniae]
MKKTVYKKLGISIIASTLLASQLSTVSALSVISSTGLCDNGGYLKKVVDFLIL